MIATIDCIPTSSVLEMYITDNLHILELSKFMLATYPLPLHPQYLGNWKKIMGN